MNFRIFYGGNLDALWDCLTRIIEIPLEVTIKGKSTLPSDLKEYAEKTIDIFDEVAEEYGDITLFIED